jgi:SAM-dependent methyltransferase
VRYEGSELEAFADARRWKSYVHDRLAPHVKGRVLEVGAGLGAFTEVLAPLAPSQWHCLEPDASLLAEIAVRRANGRIPAATTLINGTLPVMPAEQQFDTILYLDVLEHILDDRTETAAAVARLAAGGNLIVLCPAFQFVYSPFDAAIGHHRRYTRGSLEKVRPAATRIVASFYMDAPGLLLSLANRMLLRDAMPTKAQIGVWDRFVVPAARWIDPLVGRGFGRSIVAIWRRSAADSAA